MDYISFQWHTSLTIKHKRVLGAKDLMGGGLYKIQNLRAVVRESASSGSSTGCQETLNLAVCSRSRSPLCPPSPRSWQVSVPLSVLFLSICPGLLPPSISESRLPSGCWWASWKHMCQLPKRQSRLRLSDSTSWSAVWGEEKSVAGVAALQGECCLLWLFSKAISGRLLR